MIPLTLEIEIRNLLDNGLLQQEIARRLKVDRKTVAVIKSLPELRIRTQKIKAKLKKLKKNKRCRSCGGLLKLWPCLLCYPQAGYYDE